jgi:hypothetical protein
MSIDIEQSAKLHVLEVQSPLWWTTLENLAQLGDEN